MYRVSVKNKSNKPTTICLFQKGDPGVPVSLAWFCKKIKKGGKITFKWKPEYVLYCAKRCDMGYTAITDT